MPDSFFLFQYLKSHPKLVLEKSIRIQSLKPCIIEFFTQNESFKLKKPILNQFSNPRENEPLKSSFENDLSFNSKEIQLKQHSNNSIDQFENYFPSHKEKEIIVHHFGLDGKLNDFNVILSEIRSEIRFKKIQDIPLNQNNENINKNYNFYSLEDSFITQNKRLSPELSHKIKNTMKNRILEIMNNTNSNKEKWNLLLMQIRNELWKEMKFMNRRQFLYFFRQSLAGAFQEEILKKNTDFSYASNESNNFNNSIDLNDNFILNNIDESNNKTLQLKNYLLDRGNILLTLKEKDELQKQLCVSRDWLNMTIRRLSIYHDQTKITKQSKQKFKNWIQLHKKLPSNDTEFNEVINLTGWNQDQLKKVILRAKNKQNSQSLIKNTIQKYLNNHNIDSISKWSNKEESDMDKLSIELNTDSSLLKNIALSKLSKLQKNHIMNDEEKNLVKKWYDKVGNRSPTRKEFQWLKSQTNWRSQQLSSYLYSLKLSNKTNQQITKETKQILRNWIKNHQYRNPTEDEKSLILKETGWSLSQLNHQLWLLLDPPGEITETSKNFIKEWINKNGLPDSYSKRYLMEETGWSRKQLNHQLKKINSQVE